MHALSPLAVLDRGYALAFTSDGRLVRSAEQLAPGDTLVAQFARGSAAAQVTKIWKKNGSARDGAVLPEESA